MGIDHPVQMRGSVFDVEMLISTLRRGIPVDVLKSHKETHAFP
jgi:hypothetical protein